jgi:hypothetical protein
MLSALLRINDVFRSPAQRGPRNSRYSVSRRIDPAAIQRRQATAMENLAIIPPNVMVKRQGCALPDKP